jgi:hypothetical protein
VTEGDTDEQAGVQICRLLLVAQAPIVMLFPATSWRNSNTENLSNLVWRDFQFAGQIGEIVKNAVVSSGPLACFCRGQEVLVRYSIY